MDGRLCIVRIASKLAWPERVSGIANRNNHSDGDTNAKSINILGPLGPRGIQRNATDCTGYREETHQLWLLGCYFPASRLHFQASGFHLLDSGPHFPASGLQSRASAAQVSIFVSCWEDFKSNSIDSSFRLHRFPVNSPSFSFPLQVRFRHRLSFIF